MDAHSPSYPDRALDEALTDLQRLREPFVAGRTASRKEVLDALGVSTTSGPSRRRISALEQYGLVRRARAGHVSATELGTRLLAADSPEDTKEAALTPWLFQGLFNSGVDPESDRQGAVDWLEGQGVLKSVAPKVLKTYLRNMAFTGLGPSRDSGRANATPLNNQSATLLPVRVPIVRGSDRIFGSLEVPSDLRSSEIDAVLAAVAEVLKATFPPVDDRSLH